MLKGTRCYLAGAMDRVADGGIHWRRKISDVLRSFGVIPMNPCSKPIALGRESPEDKLYINKLKSMGKFDEVATLIKEVRAIDLRMVDVSDFMILNVDIDIHMCGSYEELTLANRQKKPVIIHVEQGKENCPNWIFGMVPDSFIFSQWSDVVDYLNLVNCGKIDSKRWVLFNYERLKYEN